MKRYIARHKETGLYYAEHVGFAATKENATAVFSDEIARLRRLFARAFKRGVTLEEVK